MTYAELADLINRMPMDQQSNTVTVYDSNDDEYYPVSNVGVYLLDDVLDSDHPFLIAG